MTNRPAESSVKGKLLIVDDDQPLRDRLGRAMLRKGYDVVTAGSVTDALQLTSKMPDFAVIDLRLGDGQGIDIVAALRKSVPACRIVMLTGYGNIVTAVAAVKAGAIDYLPKPADADAVDAALQGAGHGDPAVTSLPDKPMPPDRVKWEHIQRVFEQCGRNVSETARQLGMHRRTLQRVLTKYAPKEQDGDADPGLNESEDDI